MGASAAYVETVVSSLKVSAMVTKRTIELASSTCSMSLYVKHSSKWRGHFHSHRMKFGRRSIHYIPCTTSIPRVTQGHHFCGVCVRACVGGGGGWRMSRGAAQDVRVYPAYFLSPPPRAVMQTKFSSSNIRIKTATKCALQVYRESKRLSFIAMVESRKGRVMHRF